MTQVPYTSIKKKMVTSTKSIELPGVAEGKKIKVEVKNYLPQAEKIAIVSIVTGLSLKDSIVRDDIVEPLLALELVYRYTNIKFSQKDKDNALELYDELYSNGTIDAIKNAIPEQELNIIYDALDGALEDMQKVANSSLTGLVANQISQAQYQDAAQDLIRNIVGSSQE